MMTRRTRSKGPMHHHQMKPPSNIMFSCPRLPTRVLSNGANAMLRHHQVIPANQQDHQITKKIRNGMPNYEHIFFKQGP